MKILVAVNDSPTRTFLAPGILAMGYDPVWCVSAKEIQQNIQGEDPPRVALLDGTSFQEDGFDIIKQCRAGETRKMYLILLIHSPVSEQTQKMLAAGADDFIQTPVSLMELEARLQLGRRALNIQDRLMQQVEMLKAAPGSDQHPSDRLLPICSYCKKIRDEHKYWEEVEVYVKKRMYVDFSHSVCPDCMSKHYPWVDC